MTTTKDDINTRLKAISRRSGNDAYRDAAVTAAEDNYVKQSTRIGRTAGEILGGIESQNEFDMGSVILNTSIGEVTDAAGFDGATSPLDAVLAYGPGRFSINFDNLLGDSDADAEIISSGPSAGKEGGDSEMPVSGILNVLTGLGDALSKTHTGLAVAGGGGINSVISGIKEGLARQNVLADAVSDGVSMHGTDSDAAQFAGVFQRISKESYSSIAAELTDIPALRPDGGAGGESVLGEVVDAAGLAFLSEAGPVARRALSKFPTIESFIGSATDTTSSIDDLVSDIGDFTERIDASFDRGLADVGGVLQDINESITHAAGLLINGLVGESFKYGAEALKRLVGAVKGTAEERKGVVLDIASRNEAVPARMRAIIRGLQPTENLEMEISKKGRETGVPEGEIEAALSTLRKIDKELLGLDLTISGSNVIDNSFFNSEETHDIYENSAKWAGRDTPSRVFEYVASVEELDAEIHSIERDVKRVVVHASETTNDKNIGAGEIHAVNNALGFDGIVYHYVIRRDGRLQRGRPVNKPGEHTSNPKIDGESIGIVMVGGLNCSAGEANPVNFRSSRSFTMAQFNTLEKFINSFYHRYPGGEVSGHNDIEENELGPYFDVRDYASSLFRKGYSSNA